jgi:ABC-type sugar transport system substrate-binding protein
MDCTSLPLRLATGAALAAALLASGCAREAGSQITPAGFGNATMNNHLVQTCQAGPATAQGKYTARVGGCPGRTWDGQYAQVTYDGYVADAVPPPAIRTFGGVED